MSFFIEGGVSQLIPKVIVAYRGGTSISVTNIEQATLGVSTGLGYNLYTVHNSTPAEK